MQENKNEVKPPKEPDKPKKEVSEEQRQRQKKFIVYTIDGARCADNVADIRSVGNGAGRTAEWI